MTLRSEARPVSAEPAAVGRGNVHHLRLEAGRLRVLARSHPVLKPGSPAEFVYRNAVELIRGEHATESSDMANNLVWLQDLKDVISPLMPRLEDRSPKRVHRYLIRLHMYGLLCIDEDEVLVWVPKEQQ